MSKRKQPENLNDQSPRTVGWQPNGFTLVETVLATAILLFVVTAVTHAIVAGQMQAHKALERMRAVTLAHAVIEEAFSKHYKDPEGEPGLGPDPGETERTEFDDVDDFHGYTASAGSLQDAFENDLPDIYQQLSYRVEVTAFSQIMTGLSSDTPINGKQISVIVTATNSQEWTISRVITEEAH